MRGGHKRAELTVGDRKTIEGKSRYIDLARAMIVAGAPTRLEPAVPHPQQRGSTLNLDQIVRSDFGLALEGSCHQAAHDVTLGKDDD